MKKYRLAFLFMVALATTTSCSTAFLSAMSDIMVDVGDLATHLSTSSTSSSSNSYSYNSSYNTAQTSASYSSGTASNDSGSTSSGNYVATYRNWESRAESNYHSLMSASSTSGVYTAQKRSFTEAQQNMRRVRTEAAQHGVVITPSKWETATVSVSGADGTNVHKTGTHAK